MTYRCARVANGVANYVYMSCNEFLALGTLGVDRICDIHVNKKLDINYRTIIRTTSYGEEFIYREHCRSNALRVFRLWVTSMNLRINDSHFAKAYQTYTATISKYDNNGNMIDIPFDDPVIDLAKKMASDNMLAQMR